MPDLRLKRGEVISAEAGVGWRKRVGIEPTRPGETATPTDLKSARATRPRALPAPIMPSSRCGNQPRDRFRTPDSAILPPLRVGL